MCVRLGTVSQGELIKMKSQFEEEVIMEELTMIMVNINKTNEQAFEITCTRKILGGFGQARNYLLNKML
jgi:hypothetical protein